MPRGYFSKKIINEDHPQEMKPSIEIQKTQRSYLPIQKFYSTLEAIKTGQTPDDRYGSKSALQKMMMKLPLVASLDNTNPEKQAMPSSGLGDKSSSAPADINQNWELGLERAKWLLNEAYGHIQYYYDAQKIKDNKICKEKISNERYFMETMGVDLEEFLGAYEDCKQKCKEAQQKYSSVLMFKSKKQERLANLNEAYKKLFELTKQLKEVKPLPQKLDDKYVLPVSPHEYNCVFRALIKAAHYKIVRIQEDHLVGEWDPGWNDAKMEEVVAEARKHLVEDCKLTQYKTFIGLGILENDGKAAIEFLRHKEVAGKKVLDPEIGIRVHVRLPNYSYGFQDLEDTLPGDYDHPYQVVLDMAHGEGAEHYSGIEHNEREPLETLRIKAQQRLEDSSFNDTLLPFAKKLETVLQSENKGILLQGTPTTEKDLDLISNLPQISDQVRSALEQTGNGQEKESDFRTKYREFEKALKNANAYYKELVQLVNVLSPEAS